MKLCDKHIDLLTGEGDCLACKHADILEYLEAIKASHRKEILELKVRIAELEEKYQFVISE